MKGLSPQGFSLKAFNPKFKLSDLPRFKPTKGQQDAIKRGNIRKSAFGVDH